MTKMASHQEAFDDSAVDGTARFPFVALIVGESIFFNNSAMFIDGILMSNIHGGEKGARESFNLLKRDRERMSVFGVFRNQRS